MNWFKSDVNGNILIDMHSILDLLQNMAIPQLKDKQDEILQAVQSVISSGGISASQLNQILQAIEAIPSDELVNNQTSILSKIDNNTTDITTIKSTVEDIKNTSIPEIKENQINMISGINNSDTKLSNMNNMLDTIFESLEYSVEGILNAGETSITLTDSNIKEGISVEIYTSIYNVSPLTITPKDGSITITFKEQETDMGVKVVFKRPIDWSNVPDDDNSSSNVTIDGVKYSGDLSIESVLVGYDQLEIPYNFELGSAVVFNDKIHILGSYDSGYRTSHYMLVDSSWAGISMLPYEFYNGCAVVYNDEIHILGGGNNLTSHYKYTGSSWEEVSTLPYSFTCGCAVIYNDEIHILGSIVNGDFRKHYKYTGSSWEEVSTLPCDFALGTSVIYDNKLRIMDTSYGSHRWYTFNDGSWIKEESLLPITSGYGVAVVVNDNLYIIGGSTSGTSYYSKLNRLTLEWEEKIGVLPYNANRSPVVVFNNNIHVLGSDKDGNKTKHCSLNILYRKIN